MTAVQEFKNSHLNATLETLPNCQLRFQVEVNPGRAKELRAKAIKAISKEVNIPGFRPGKAPENLIEKQYGKHVEKEFRDLASQSTVSEVVNLSRLYPMKQEGGVKLEKFQVLDSGALEISFSYETFPQVPEVKTDQFTLTPQEVSKVDDKEIDKTLKEIQIYHAKWNEVEERPAKEGDFVVIDIDVIDEPAFRAYENSRFHAIEGGMPAWARKLVLGLSVGESKEGLSEREGDSDEEFIPRTCRITLHMIQSADLPPLDDELSKKAGVQTVEELRNNIRNQLLREKEKAVREDLRMQVRDQLIEKYPFDLPVTDLKNLDNDCRQLVERDKSSLKTPEEAKAYHEQLFKNGLGVVRLAYLLPHLASQLKIQLPTEKEANARLVEVLTHHYLRTQEKVPEDQYPYIFQKIQRDLLMEHVIDNLIEKNLPHPV